MTNSILKRFDAALTKAGYGGSIDDVQLVFETDEEFIFIAGSDDECYIGRFCKEDGDFIVPQPLNSTWQWGFEGELIDCIDFIKENFS